MRSVTIPRPRAFAYRTHEGNTMYKDQCTDQMFRSEQKAEMEQIYFWIRRGSPFPPNFQFFCIKITMYTIFILLVSVTNKLRFAGVLMMAQQ